MSRIIKISSIFCLLLIIFAKIAHATPIPNVLFIKEQKVDVNGKISQVFKIEQGDGSWGFQGVKGQMFDVIVKNMTKEPTVIHWHGLIVPNDQDGVPYVTQAPIPPGGQYHYRFPLRQSGTYWMHSHFGLQIQQLLSAPLIIHDPKEIKSDKEVTMLITDFSDKQPNTIFSELKKGKKMPHMAMKSHEISKQDLNDVNYNAFLTNYRTLKNPEIIPIESGQKVRLRIIAGGAMTNFFINTGSLKATAIAVDGHAIQPFVGSQFQLAVGQRIDLLVTIPKGKKAYPILAQGEGTSLQTGLILATPHARVPTLSEHSKNIAGALDYQQERQLAALHPLPPIPPDQSIHVDLQGDMKHYIWSINNEVWPKIHPMILKGKRIEMVFRNQTRMAHPMHLHGHVFQVTEIDGQPLKNGAMRDTVLVLPNSTVKIQFEANNPGNWMLHCHMLYHQQAGMMTIVTYPGMSAPSLVEDKN